ncbi:hypothetical protein [Kitasatospora sp. NPDC059327]|uniref:hypothetical protein n=1 Tax=Kitasatospora sp. NPDC059327 TaxID=3346803 RepID=UPI0036739ACD
MADRDRTIAEFERAVEELAATWAPSSLASDWAPSSLLTMPVGPGLEGTAFHEHLVLLLGEFAKALLRAEDESRRAADAHARNTTAAAVTSVAASVVSLGTEVSQLIGEAMRRHAGDEVYATLSGLDHAVQQLLRQGQSFLVVYGGVPGRRWPPQPLTDVVRGAIGRVRDFERVRYQELSYQLTGRAVEPVVHAIATLLDNALRYSPPNAVVEVGFLTGHHGVSVVIDDAGMRMSPEQLAQANSLLAGHRVVDVNRLGPAPAIGLPAVAALAARYGFNAFVDAPNIHGGTRAIVFLPHHLLAAPATVAPVPEAQGVPRIPVPAATDGGLPRRTRREPSPLPPKPTAGALSSTPPTAAPIAAWAATRRSRAGSPESLEGTAR